MKKLYIFMVGMALVISTQPLLAQHSGHGMGGMGTGSSGHIDTTMSDMQKMMAVQATEEQSVHLRSWLQSTATLSKQLDELRGLAASNGSGEFSNALNAFKTALEANVAVHDEFVNNLSGPQRSGLKKPVQKLDKAKVTLVKTSAELSGTAGHAKNAKQLADVLQKTKKAIDELQREQQRLVSEMGAKV